MLSRINNTPNDNESVPPAYDVAVLRSSLPTFRINIAVSSSGRINHREKKTSWDISTLEGRYHYAAPHPRYTAERL